VAIRKYTTLYSIHLLFLENVDFFGNCARFAMDRLDQLLMSNCSWTVISNDLCCRTLLMCYDYDTCAPFLIHAYRIELVLDTLHRKQRNNNFLFCTCAQVFYGFYINNISNEAIIFMFRMQLSEFWAYCFI
jgi:hypothetical protein